ncbi:hypothetical protein SAMN05444141_108224 [Pseudovibrio denitrificans]|uniref:Cytochrome C and Quinol oxidase polypeptide I n=1 Tax=Pseudovibrio denitrificans TaxID=258256 RepID=A0A1I7DEA1_9HYPH|nr:hypothetical protein [Pseudovibrio denitrificans]SFU10008.1 hypothetical protein SAMN05444141_108224 [Pseudovibrio denitrificans]
MNKIAICFLGLASISSVLGIALGGMVLEGDYEFMPVHAHLLLLGWLSNGIFGLYYRTCGAVQARLSVWAHFLLALGATALMPTGLLLVDSEDYNWVIWFGASFASLSAVAFLLNLILLEKSDKLNHQVKQYLRADHG